jgi:hypothetical protein
MNSSDFLAAVQKIIGIPLPGLPIEGWVLPVRGNYLNVATSPFSGNPYTIFLQFTGQPFPGLGENPNTGKWNIVGIMFGNSPDAVLRELSRRLAAAGYVPPPGDAGAPASDTPLTDAVRDRLMAGRYKPHECFREWQNSHRELERRLGLARAAMRKAREHTTPMGSSFTRWYDEVLEILGKGLEESEP